MKAELLELLRCPKTGQKLMLQDADFSGQEIQTGLLISEDGKGGRFAGCR